jgi:hypothetical protein
MTELDLRTALDRLADDHPPLTPNVGHLLRVARTARRRRAITRTAIAIVVTAAVVGLGPSVTGLADRDHRHTVTAAFPAQWTDAALLDRCAQIGNADNEPEGRPFDGARVVRWQSSATAVFSIIVTSDGRHWASCELFAAPAEFPGYVNWHPDHATGTPDGLQYATGRNGFVFIGRFPAEVARVEWIVDGHPASQIPDDGFVVIVMGQVTDMQPREVFLRIYDANGALLGQSGERAGHEYDLPRRYLPVAG